MCGIVGVCFRDGEAAPTLIAGLRSLEYRGYDSAGVVVHAPGLPTRRAQGRVDLLVQRLVDQPLPKAASGIAHTRWATHGAPLERNAHPHRWGRLTAVHNGILENFEALRDEFRTKGGEFRSDTDSEVWVALIAHELGKSHEAPTPPELLSAIARAMGRARGSYALAILHEALPGQVFFARNESPLVLGLADHGNFLASDVAALLEQTHDFIYLEDGMLGRIWAGGYEVFDRSLRRHEPRVDQVSWDAEAAEKGGYPHFMLKEIEEQAAVVARTLQKCTSVRQRVLPDFEVPDRELRRFRRVVMLACGTALHAARLGKYVVEGCAGLPVDVDFASEFRYRDPMVGPDDLVLAISQSGETADTLGALRVAIDKGATPIAICNVRGSSLTRLATATVLTECGPEIGVASTKAFTGQILALHLLAMRLGMARGAISEPELLRRLQVLRELVPAMDKLIGGEARDHVQAIAEKYQGKPIFFFLGRGPDYPIALEGALKLKEISYVHAEGYPAGEMKHGPLALVSPDMVVVTLAGDGPTHEKVVGNMQEVKARGGIVVALTNTEKREAIEMADDVILVPRADPLVQPILNVIPLQYLAYYVALARGCDIDKPRNLAKSVTVE